MELTIREKVAIYCLMLIIKIAKPQQYDYQFDEWDKMIKKEIKDAPIKIGK